MSRSIDICPDCCSPSAYCDCFALNPINKCKCLILNYTDFKDNKCTFYKTIEDVNNGTKENTISKRS